MTTPVQPTERARRDEAQPRGQRRVLGLPMPVVIIGGVVFVGALGFILWRRAQSNAASIAANAPTGATTASTDTGAVDYGGQLSVIQSELEALLQGQATDNSMAAGGGSSGSSGGSSGGSGTSGTGTGTTTASIAPTGGKVLSVGKTGATIGWNPNGAARWQTKIVGPGPINGKVSTVSVPKAVFWGLSSNHNYEVTVTPFNSSGTPGPSGQVDFHTTK